MSPAAAIRPARRPALLDRALVSAFLENIPDHVHFKDRDSRFLALSRSLVRHLGAASSADVVGRTDFDFLAPEHAQRTREDEERILRTGQPFFNRLEREERADGTVRWVLTSKLPLRDETGGIVGTFGLSKDVTRTREMELALQQAHKELIDASRAAGMAEVGNGVLHNVGNVLNSLNVSASVIATGLRASKVESLARLASLLRDQKANLADFLTTHPRGRRVPEFLESLARHALEERGRLLQEIGALQRNIDHIKEIVSMQQTYATMVGVVEPLEPELLMEDALRMNAGALVRRAVQVERDFQFVPAILGEKAKVLQILVNLIRNAQHACDEVGRPDRRLTLRIRPAATPGRVQLVVADNGVGIPAENLTRIFAHGFTTRAQGHGFGLHSSANAAREMKGALAVHSDGPGCGATFTLELPVAPPAIPAS